MSNNDVKEDKEKEEKNNEIKIKESDAPYYSDEERNIYKISTTPLISEISIIKVFKK